MIGDKAYVSAKVQGELLARRGISLVSLPHSNQKQQVPGRVRQTINRIRQIMETVNNQQAEQFNIERNHAHSFWGLCTRLQTKLAAHTLCIYLNRLLGNADFLRIKRLAFPN